MDETYVNPDERISCADILQHPWIKLLDNDSQADSCSEGGASLSSQSSSSLFSSQVSQSSPVYSLQPRKGSQGSAQGSQFPSKLSKNPSSSGHNSNHLAAAFRHLSGHVRQRQSEKLAHSVTRLVSLLQQNQSPTSGAGGGMLRHSTLSTMYLIPVHTADIEVIAQTTSANQTEDSELDAVLLNSDFREGTLLMHMLPLCLFVTFLSLSASVFVFMLFVCLCAGFVGVSILLFCVHWF